MPKIFEVAEDEKCGYCNWRVGRLYLLAESQARAEELYEAEGGALCARCLVEMIMDRNMIVKEAKDL